MVWITWTVSVYVRSKSKLLEGDHVGFQTVFATSTKRFLKKSTSLDPEKAKCDRIVLFEYVPLFLDFFQSGEVKRSEFFTKWSVTRSLIPHMANW